MFMTLLLGTLLWLLCVAIYMATPAKSIFHPATYYLFFHGLVFTLRPWMNVYWKYNYIYKEFHFYPTESEKILALQAADLGLVVFMFFVLVVGRQRLIMRPTAGEPGDAQRRFRAPFLVAVLLTAPLGVYSLHSRIVNKLTDAQTMTLDPTTGTFTSVEGNGYIAESNALLIPAVVLIPWLFRFRWWSFIPFVLYTLARLSDGSARWTFVMAAASLGLLFLYDHRRRWMEPRILLMGLVMVALFSMMTQRDLFRTAVLGQAPEALTAQQLEIQRLQPMEDANFGNQEFLEFLVHAIPDRTQTYEYFVDNLQVLTEPIPRQLWPEKPIGQPIRFFKLFDYGYPIGMTRGLPGEGWTELGWLGVVIWSSLFGIIWGWIYNSFARSRQTEFQVALYCLILPLSVQFFRDGLLTTFVKFPMFYYVLLLLWWILARIMGRRSTIFPRTSTFLAQSAVEA